MANWGSHRSGGRLSHGHARYYYQSITNGKWRREFLFLPRSISFMTQSPLSEIWSANLVRSPLRSRTLNFSPALLRFPLRSRSAHMLCPVPRLHVICRNSGLTSKPIASRIDCSYIDVIGSKMLPRESSFGWCIVYGRNSWRFPRQIASIECAGQWYGDALCHRWQSVGLSDRCVNCQLLNDKWF